MSQFSPKIEISRHMHRSDTQNFFRAYYNKLRDAFETQHIFGSNIIPVPYFNHSRGGEMIGFGKKVHITLKKSICKPVPSYF